MGGFNLKLADIVWWVECKIAARQFSRSALLFGVASVCLVAFCLCSFASVSAVDEGGAEAFFRKGANSYIGKQMKEAKQYCEAGLKKHPSDRKLQELEKLLEQQEKTQDQQQDQKKQKKQNQQQNDQKKQQPEQDQQKKEQQEEEQQNKEHREQRPKQQSSDQQKGAKQQQKEQRRKPKEMTKEEAKQILDAMKQEEKAKRDKMRMMLGRPQKVDKNW